MSEKVLEGLLPVNWNEVSALWYEIQIRSSYRDTKDSEQSRANAALIAGRILFRLEEQVEYVLSELECISDNQNVPCEGRLLIGIAEVDEGELSFLLEELSGQLRKEAGSTQESWELLLTKCDAQALPAIHPRDLQKTVFYLIQLPDGPLTSGGMIPSGAKAGSSLTGVSLMPDGLHTRICLGSLSDSAEELLQDKICYLTEFLGGECMIIQE